MTTKKIKNTWVFYGEVDGKYYYFEDMENRINTFEESVKADIGIILWLHTGDHNQVRPDLRNEIGFQYDYQDTEVQMYGEEITEAYITAKIGEVMKYEFA